MDRVRFDHSQLAEVAKNIVKNAEHKVLCLHGPMGVGKTTLVKALLMVLGASDSGNSPTFGIVNEYHHNNGKLLAYHFDCYRLEDEMEAYDLGFEEYLAKNVWVFIEWPEKITGLLPLGLTDIFLELEPDFSRSLQLKNP